jgi:hypothetical protein
MQLQGQGLIQQQSPELKQHVGVIRNPELPMMFQLDDEVDPIWRRKMTDTSQELQQSKPQIGSQDSFAIPKSIF